MRARFGCGYLLLCAFCAIAPQVQATTLTVTNLNDSGAGSLREAIEAANNASGADTIVFLAGLSGTLQLASTLPEISTDLHVQGPGAGAITIRGQGAAIPFRIFEIHAPSSTPVVTISGLTITNGHITGTGASNHGGAIYNFEGMLTIQDCVITGNSASGTGKGGAIFNRQGSAVGTRSEITLVSCTLSNNIASAGGGAIHNRSGFGGTMGGAYIYLTNCILSGNAGAFSGGAIFNEAQDEGRPVIELTACTSRTTPPAVMAARFTAAL